MLGFIRSKSDEGRNQIHLKNGSKYSIVSLYRTHGIALHTVRVDYVCVCGEFFYSITY